MSKRSLILAAAILLLAAPLGASAAGPVPVALKKLRPHQVVEQVMAQREMLTLTDAQFAALDDLALAIRTEKHQYRHRGGKPHVTRHVPMVSRQEAFDDAMAILSAGQQARFTALNPAPIMEAARRRVPHRAPGKP